jgi:hypothetical protein
LPLCAVGKKPR